MLPAVLFRVYTSRQEKNWLRHWCTERFSQLKEVRTSFVTVQAMVAVEDVVSGMVAGRAVAEVEECSSYCKK